MVPVLIPTAQQCLKSLVFVACNTNLISRVDNYFCSSAASTPLTVKEIQNELREMTAAIWYQLGVQLEIPLAKLTTIESDHPRDAQRCLTEVINRWLRNTPECSWTKLARAVEAMGDYTVLAEKLNENVPRLVPTFFASIAAFLTVT